MDSPPTSFLCFIISACPAEYNAQLLQCFSFNDIVFTVCLYTKDIHILSAGSKAFLRLLRHGKFSIHLYTNLPKIAIMNQILSKEECP
ncbi:hypothetical protein HMPREF1545_01277 [Oscillibacter sp. KLE 1728]|nr:hypothetical protein HMPREF1545_01277 [Oscillibacter sp. KLE 1728]ERK68195.1 hypothetical protein HMPREF1546_00218 [Oscillibacter sp. KLE 1745]